LHEAALRDEAAALAKLGRWREAEVALRKLVALRPDDNELRFDWAAALLRLRSHFEAADALKKVVASDPNHDRAWFNLAVAHQSLGRLEDAVAAWGRAIALKPTTAARLQRGTLLLDLRDFAAAAADFEWVLAHEPVSIDASHNLATAYRRLGRYDEARRTLATVLDRRRRHVPTINRLAEIAWEQSQQAGADAAALTREAIERCAQSLEVDATQTDVIELKAAAEARLAKLAPPG
jgi:tetratricopeptide (TPR) repeat protein